MKKNSFIKYFGLLGSFLVLACISFQQNELVVGQEKKDEQPVQQRVPDDLTDNLYFPTFVHRCLDKNGVINKEIDIPDVPLHNPYFVRGDFDGDNSIDYAVIVESRKNKREGLLICFRNKETKAVLLGLDPQNPPPFWLLMNWDVETLEEVRQTLDSNGKPVGIEPKGESIVMKGEDWIGIIYWDGKKFLWKKVILK
ncbi:MAG: hypothetical protein D6735_09020 [Acidobacteria bacterium]|jgi:hypothetical protein|nr:MAG: hypothetical protein D6735_09020 [Acidobacteriota bacterium]